MKMKTTMAVIALAAFMAFAGFAVFENNASDAAGYELMGYGESSDATATKLGDVQAFYWENSTDSKNPVLRIYLPEDPKSDVSISINSYTGETSAPVLGESVSIVEVVRSAKDIRVYTSDLTDESATKNYIVTITPLAGGDAYTTFLSTNPAGYAKVTFDENTGDVASGQAPYVEDYVIKGVADNVTLPASTGTYEKEGYTAGKWSADKTSKAALIDDAGKATISADTTYYVMWAYEITFQGNGGKTTGDAPATSTTQTEYFGVTGTLVANPFTFTDANSQTYAYYKWSDAADSIETLTDDEAALPDAAHTYYAIWTYTITFNKDLDYVTETYDGAVDSGGTTADITVYLGAALIGSYSLEVNKFAYTHLDYLGWALASGQSEAKADLDTVTYEYNYGTAFDSATHKATLYAVWEPHQYTVLITGFNADVKYYKAVTFGADPTYDPAEGSIVEFKDDGSYLFIRDDDAETPTRGITYWDKVEIVAHEKYQINSVFYTIDGTSTTIEGAGSPAMYTFTKVITGDATISITDKLARSIYGHVTNAAITPVTELVPDNDDLKLTFNDVIFDDSSALLVINKKTSVAITGVYLYGYQKFVATESAEAVLIKDITTSGKLAESRYTIAFEDIVKDSVYYDVVIVVTYGLPEKPYTDFYLSDAQNNGSSKATAEVTMRSASDSEFEIVADSMKILGTYFGVETLGDESVVVYGALTGTELVMQANGTGSESEKTFTPTISFVASSADLNIYWVYAQYTYTWDEAEVVDKTGGLLVVQTYDVNTSATYGTPAQDVTTTMTGDGTYIAGATVTITVANAGTASGSPVSFSKLLINDTEVTGTESGDNIVYNFVISGDASVVAVFA